MNLRESARIARKNLMANKIRSGLSMIGLVVGIAAATLVTAISNGMRLAALESFATFGTNALYVHLSDSLPEGSSRTLSQQEIGRVGELPFVEAAFLLVRSQREARGELASSYLIASGILPRYLDVHGISLREGRPFNERDIADRSHVCIINTDLARRFYGSSHALGKALRYGDATYEVVGLAGPPKTPYSSLLSEIYIPQSTLLRHEDAAMVQSGEVWIRQDYPGDPKEGVLAALSGDRRDLGRFVLREPEALAEEMAQTSRKFRLGTLALAVTALFVGGVGIMNVMIISVAERTEEIGLRKAIGASARDILLQFVVEVSILSALGGVAGVILGVGASWIIPKIVPEFSTAIMPAAISASLVCSVGVGAVFGLYPAIKASQLSPLEALRR